MILRVFIGVLLIAFFSACAGPAYYLQAMSGQWKLMHSRQDIQSLLDDPATSPALLEQLKQAEQLKLFARSSLYLPDNGSYSSYVEIDADALLWNVVATGEFSLQARTWCFPVAGCVPYRGYFKQNKAQAFAEKLRGKGMDVLVSPAAAYSSLGWFDDPLLSTMFSDSDSHLAAFLFHELAHQRLYIRDDGVFNESYASFVEETGVQLWLESRQQDELQKWQHLKDVKKDFSELIGYTRSELNKLYQSSKTDPEKRRLKADVFASLTSSYENLINEKWSGQRYYQSWFENPPNNAKLALYNTYQGSHCAFQVLWLETGGDMPEFHRLAEQKSRLVKEQRKNWLEQTC